MMPLQEEADADAAEAAAMVWGLIVVSTRWNRFDGKKLGIFSLKTGHLLWLKSTNILILSNIVNRNHQATAVLWLQTFGHQGRCTVAGEPQVAQRVGEFARLGALAAEWGGHLSWRFNLIFSTIFRIVGGWSCHCMQERCIWWSQAVCPSSEGADATMKPGLELTLKLGFPDTVGARS